MENAVKAICQALIEEAGLVISHTDKIAALGSSDARTTAQAIGGMRLDAVEHIQNLTLELTRLITSGEEPGEAKSGGEPEGEGEAE